MCKGVYAFVYARVSVCAGVVWLHRTTPAKQGSRAREGVGNVLGEVTYLSGDAGLRSTG